MCRGLLEGFGTTWVSFFVKSYVSLGVVFGVGRDIDSVDFSDAGRFFNTESMTSGGMMMGTCLGLRLLKPASLVSAKGSEVYVEGFECIDGGVSVGLEAEAKYLAKN